MLLSTALFKPIRTPFGHEKHTHDHSTVAFLQHRVSSRPAVNIDPNFCMPASNTKGIWVLSA